MLCPTEYMQNRVVEMGFLRVIDDTDHIHE